MSLEMVALHLFGQFYTSCKSFNAAIQRTDSAGRDIRKMKRLLDVQCCRLSHTGQILVEDLEHPFSQGDLGDPRTTAAVNTFIEIKEIYEACEKLVKKYDGDVQSSARQSTQQAMKHAEPTQSSTTGETVTGTRASTSAAAPSESVTSIAEPDVISNEPVNSNTDVIEDGEPQAERPDSKGKGKETLAIQSSVRAKYFSKVRRLLRHGRIGDPSPANVVPISDVSLRPALPESSAFARISEAEQEKGRQYQAQLSTQQRWKWAFTDYKQLESYVERLQLLTSRLEGFMRVKPCSEPGRRRLVTNKDFEYLDDEARSAQDALMRLHCAVRSMNPTDMPCTLNLQLVQDIRASGEEFKNQTDFLYLRPGARYWYIQRHESGQSKHSDLFVSETVPNEASASSQDLEDSKISYELKPAKERFEESNDDGYVRWGAVKRPREGSDYHWLFKDQANQWQVHKTLEELFSDSHTASIMTCNQRLGLASVVARSYLYLFILLRQSRALDMKNFLYYVPRRDDILVENAYHSTLQPFLEFGFGQRRGTSTLSERDPTTIIHELGVQLVHVALCTTMTNNLHGPNNTSTQRRDWAQNKLHEMESLLGLTYTEIIRDCLQFCAAPVDREKGLKLGHEHLTYVNVRLSELVQQMRTRSAGDRVPPWKGTQMP